MFNGCAGCIALKTKLYNACTVINVNLCTSCEDRSRKSAGRIDCQRPCHNPAKAHPRRPTRIAQFSYPSTVLPSHFSVPFTSGSPRLSEYSLTWSLFTCPTEKYFASG